MLKQACESSFGIGTGRPAAGPVLPKVLPLIAIAAFVLLAVAQRWYWHESAAIVNAQTLQAQEPHDGGHDFDFYVGKWRLHNRRLLHPLTGSNEWIEFNGTSVARTMWNGRANVDEFEANTPSGHVEGMTVRLYNAETHEWSLYWANGQTGAFSAPAAVGHFINGRGQFYEHEEISGRRVFVRLLWEIRSPKQYHWEQAFSVDEGRTWETNWTIDSSRMEGPAL